MQNTLVAPVGILGFGVEGQSTFNYLVRTGIKDIVVMDKNPVNQPAVQVPDERRPHDQPDSAVFRTN